MRSNFTPEETQAILSEHYPWAATVVLHRCELETLPRQSTQPLRARRHQGVGTMSQPQTPLARKERSCAATYRAFRYWNLCELRLIRAKLRVGNTTAANATKDRRAIQRDLVALRRGRS
jgi:hypothetical protein